MALLTFSVGITLGLVEVFLRSVLFNEDPALDFLRRPSLYAVYHRDGREDHFNEDYWKLNYLFNRPFNVVDPHPQLGWTGFFDKTTYEHADQAFSKGKRPVLLFGDSFAMCVDSTQCFEDFLNADPAFSKNHYFLNYGVGGYGLDQIHILMKEVVPRHENPLVIFSLLTTDMDRSMLYMRDSHKGRFVLEDGQLKLTNVPITQSTEEFVTSNPPQITSYTINMIKNGWMNVFGEPDRYRWKYVKEMKDLNEALVRLSVEELRAAETDFLILLFQARANSPNEWRNVFLRNLFEELDVPYISSADIIRDADEQMKRDRSAYVIIGDGHPTTFANGLVAEQLKKYVLKGELEESMDGRNRWPEN